MAVHRITKGLDLPIAGDPQQVISAAAKIRHVALLGADYLGMKPKMEAKVGDRVQRGQLLFEDRKTPGVRFTAPSAGTVLDIKRGEKRAFQALVIAVEDGGETDDQVQFQAYSGADVAGLGADQIKALLLESGLWTALRTRPFSRVPSPESEPRAIFVTAVDTNPHAPDVAVVLKGREADFKRGLVALAKLAPKLFVCKSPKLQLDTAGVANVQVEDFEGVHPAGNVGTHIHMLAPVSAARVVWHLGYQDVIAIGVLFATGKLDSRRVISLAGPQVKRPRLIQTVLGASVDELVVDELAAGENRVVSGSVLSGRKASGDIDGFLGRYHLQVSALLEGRHRELLGWLAPGAGKFTIIPVYFGFLGKLFGKKFNMTTTTNGSPRAMVPIGMYERVMPLDIHPTFLLRSLLVGDTDRAVQLGALELDEEDLALCTFVDPGKADFGVVLRKNLSEIEKEGLIPMQFLRNLLDKAEKPFHKGGKLEKFYPLYEATDTFLYTPPDVTKASSHVRDAIDLKRMMITVVVALLPCVLFAMYNTGFQANYAIAHGASALANWQTSLFQMLGFGFDPGSILACMIHGALYFLPVYLVTMLVGGHAEVIFAIARKHEINEGFLVTGLLFPLTLPPTIPLWQVALGIIFGVVIGKEIFGGTGMNVLNPALVSRAFLFFAYPGQISGDKVWIAADLAKADGLSGATALAQAAANTPAMMGSWDWWSAFVGLVPGSMGETSTLACLIGAAILIITGVGSWRTMLGVTLGTLGMAALLNAIGSETNSMFGLPPIWHMVLGGWAFGMVFMATDPVSSAFTAWGKLLYGFGIGVLVVLVRVINPAYPEGMMLAILFMNMFAPLIDHFIVTANIKRRMAHYGTR